MYIGAYVRSDAVFLLQLAVIQKSISAVRLNGGTFHTRPSGDYGNGLSS